MQPSHRHRRHAAALLVLLALAAPGLAGEKVVRRTAYFDLVVDDTTGLKSKTIREIEKEATKALQAGLDLLGINAKQVFYVGLPTPTWMGKHGKLSIVILPEVSDRHCGLDYWVTQLYAGGYRMELPSPGESLTPEFRSRLWREVGVTILGNTLYKARVPWWSEGILAHLAATGGGEDGKERARCRQAAASIPRKELAKRLESVLRHGPRKNFDANHGPALGFVIVDLLAQSRPDILRHLQRQLQLMAFHLESFPGEQTLRKDFAQIAFEQLEKCSLGPERLAPLLAGWIDEGLPCGSAFRKSKLSRKLRKIELPPVFEVELAGSWSKARFDDDNYRYFTFERGRASWHLPSLRSKYLVWAGFHLKLPRGVAFAPDRLSDGLGLTLGKGEQQPDARWTFKNLDAYYAGPSFKYEFILLVVTSKSGNVYRFYRYWKAR